MRAVAVGRNNYIFAGSDAGAESAATIYSIVQSCQLQGVDPLAYLTDVLGRRSVRPTTEYAAGTRWTRCSPTAGSRLQSSDQLVGDPIRVG